MDGFEAVIPAQAGIWSRAREITVATGMTVRSNGART